jgi:hypothetical protein
VVAACVVGNSNSNSGNHAAVVRLTSTLTADTFGTGGTAVINTIPSGYTGAENGDGNQLLVRDGSGNYYMVFRATGNLDVNGKAQDNGAFVAKLDTNGAAVNTFGTSGNALVIQTLNDANNKAQGRTLALDASGNILVGGEKPRVPADPNCTGCQDGFVARMNSSTGALDNTFGTNGIATIVINNGSSQPIALLPTAGGKILVLAQNFMLRLNANGSVDNSFNSNATNVNTLNNTNASDTSQWGGIFQDASDTNSALLLGGVNGSCVGVNLCGPQTLTSPNQAIVTKVRVVTDTTPNAFAFTNQSGVALNTLVSSNAVAISGINSAAPISVSGTVGSAYSINNAAFTNVAGTINNGDSVRVQHTSSSAGSTMVSTTLTIGGVNGTFSSTTVAADTTPDAFTFTAQTNKPLNAVVQSNTVTISGINAPASIGVSGAAGSAYSIGCNGTFSTANSTISNGQTVCVHQTSSGSPLTKTTATLNVGGVTANFDVTTGNGDTTPDAFTFKDQTGVATGAVISSDTITVSGIDTPAPISISAGTAYSVNGAAFTAASGFVTNGQTVQVRLTSSSSANTTVSAVLNIGGVTDSFDVTTGANDTTPDQFTFVNQADVAQNSTITSAPITVSGINAATVIAVSGGSYSINGGAFSIANATVNNNDMVRLQHTSAGTSNTATNTTVSIGGISATFTSTTAPDTTPDQFSFSNQGNVTRSTVITSNAVMITGIDGPSPISVVGGTYSISCDPNGFTGAAGTISSTQTVCVRHTSSASFSTGTTTTLTIGGVNGAFTSTTEVQDTTPNAFAFNNQTNVAKGVVITSTPITVSGINSPASIGVGGAAGSTYSVNGGAFTAVAGTVNSGDTVVVRHTSSANDNTATSTTLTIGGVPATFTSTTGDGTPNAFSFTSQNGVQPGSIVTSNSVTVAGMTLPAAISVVGGAYSINGGAFTAAAGTVSNGQTVQVQHTASAAFSTTTTTTLTIGGVSGTFSSATVAADSMPDAFTFVDQTNVAKGVVVTSAAITVSGINTPANIGVSGAAGSTYSINGGAFTAVAGTVSNGQTVQVRHTSSANDSTATNTVLTIGGVSDTFTSTTGDGTPAAFSFVDQSGVQPGSTVTSAAITVSGISIAAPISVSSGSYSINGGAFTAAAGSVSNGQTVQVRHTAAAGSFATTNTVLTIGGVSDTFTSTTLSSATVTTAGGAVTMTASQGQITSFTNTATPPAGVPAGYTFPLGFFNYTVTGVPAGGTVTFVFTLPAGTGTDSYIKCAATCAPFAGASVSGNTLTLTITDNGAGDSNATAGTIVDPGAPAVTAKKDDGGGAMEWLTLLLMGIPGLLRLRRRAP